MNKINKMNKMNKMNNKIINIKGKKKYRRDINKGIDKDNNQVVKSRLAIFWHYQPLYFIYQTG